MSAVQRLCGRAILLHDGVIAHTGSVAEVISVYMGQTKANEVRFDNQPIKRAAVRQIASQLELVVEYATERAAHLPCLGFVISDASGNPICGSNPIVDFLENTAPSRRSGRITVVVSEPKLLNGTYRLSLWFGNGKDDYFHARDCLTFDVTNMAGLRQLPPSQVGPVAPQCKWVFE
jgi:lipopolysaccharide transport system ATP-binding protein